MFRSYFHLGLHVLVPAVIAAVFFRQNYLRAWLTMTATMLVDVDHLLADPVYDPWRCSIGLHPLHRFPAIAGYGLLMFWPRLRLVAIGLAIHMGLDGLDCVWMQYEY
jgi:hypothetical protein